ncbi:tryptophan--tRNA ligase [bacterium]|nr:tryptophan--tRNA ligase [bacterium]
MTSKKRILSGNRPTGKLHWGNYFGALKNWVDLQDEYECFFFVADWHSLTSEYDNVKGINESVHEILIDWLAAGLDPKKSTIFIQSLVPEHAELHVLLSMITPLGWLERVPTYKDMKNELKNKDLNMYGFFGYPVLQTADIIIYNADKVPVGEDQVAHIELSREIVRRFHNLTQTEIFNEPKPLLTPAPRVPGVDGRKMSKSFDNAIYLSDDEATVEKKLMRTITDPQRKRRNDPGDPEVCNIWYYHKLYTDKSKQNEIHGGCTSGTFGCVDCKKLCAVNANEYWKEFRIKRAKLAKDPAKVLKVALDGSKKAQKDVQALMDKVRAAMGVSYK